MRSGDPNLKNYPSPRTGQRPREAVVRAKDRTTELFEFEFGWGSYQGRTMEFQKSTSERVFVGGGLPVRGASEVIL